MRYVIIDDGHGANTPGKRSPIFETTTKIGGRIFRKGEHFRENEFNMATADYLEALCRAAGWHVRQLAPEHEDITLRTRLAREHQYYREALRLGCDPVVVSIHANASEVDGFVVFNNGRGIETFYHEGSRKGRMLAQHVQARLIEGTGLRNRGVKTQPSFFMTRETKSPAILVEYGFMTHREELALLVSDNYRRLCARLTFNGLRNYYEKLATDYTFAA